MAISDLQAKQGNVDVTGEVMSKETVREFEKFGKKGRVCNAMLKDDSGEIKLSLWNEQVDQVKVGGEGCGDCPRLFSFERGNFLLQALRRRLVAVATGFCQRTDAFLDLKDAR